MIGCEFCVRLRGVRPCPPPPGRVHLLPTPSDKPLVPQARAGLLPFSSGEQECTKKPEF